MEQIFPVRITITLCKKAVPPSSVQKTSEKNFRIRLAEPSDPAAESIGQ